MSFHSQNLRVVAYAGGFTLWHYRTGDSKQQVADARYFAKAIGVIRKGDIIIVESTRDEGRDGETDMELAIFAVVADTNRRLLAESVLGCQPETNINV